jgi:hypothetical protein
MGTLVPYALILNRLLLTDAAHVESNKAQLKKLFGAGLQKSDVPFHSATIDVYGDLPWTVRDSEGHSAPLMRPPGAADLKTKVAEQDKQIADLKRQLAAVKGSVPLAAPTCCRSPPCTGAQGLQGDQGPQALTINGVIDLPIR